MKKIDNLTLIRIFDILIKIILIGIMVTLVFTVFGCEKDPIDPEMPPPPVVQKTPPESFTLVAPAQSSQLSSQSVTFSWNKAKYATEYQLVIKQASTVVHNESYSGTSATVSLELGQSYSWQVTASNDDGEKTSSSYSFSTLAEAAVAVVTEIQKAPYFDIVFDEGTKTIYPTMPLGFDRDDLDFVIEISKQICSTCEPEQIDIRPVENLGQLQEAIPIVPYSVFYITLTASKLPPGEAQVSFTKAFYPQFRD